MGVSLVCQVNLKKKKKAEPAFGLSHLSFLYNLLENISQ